MHLQAVQSPPACCLHVAHVDTQQKSSSTWSRGVSALMAARCTIVDFLALNWAPFLEKAATMKPHYRWLHSVHEPCLPKAAGCLSGRAFLEGKAV